MHDEIKRWWEWKSSVDHQQGLCAHPYYTGSRCVVTDCGSLLSLLCFRNLLTLLSSYSVKVCFQIVFAFHHCRCQTCRVIVSVIRFTSFKELCYTVGIVSPGNQLNSMYDGDCLMRNPFNTIVQSGRTDIITKCYSQQFLSHYFANDS